MRIFLLVFFLLLLLISCSPAPPPADLSTTTIPAPHVITVVPELPTATPEPQAALLTRLGKGMPTALAWSPDGRLLAVATSKQDAMQIADHWRQQFHSVVPVKSGTRFLILYSGKPMRRSDAVLISIKVQQGTNLKPQLMSAK